MPGGLTLLTGTGASIPSPPVGKITIFFNTDTNLPSYKDSAGIIYSLVGSIGLTGSLGIPGEQGDEPDFLIALPGPQGNPGPTGTQGPLGPVMVLEDGEDGQDSFIPGPAGAAGVSGSTTLTRSQIIVPHAGILTANTVPIELAPAPGAGKLLIPIAMITVKETTAGGYATNPTWSIRYDGLAIDLVSGQSITITSADKRLRSFAMVSLNITSPPFNTRIMWRGSADTTSGNVANYIVVSLVYEIVTDGP